MSYNKTTVKLINFFGSHSLNYMIIKIPELVLSPNVKKIHEMQLYISVFRYIVKHQICSEILQLKILSLSLRRKDIVL